MKKYLNQGIAIIMTVAISVSGLQMDVFAKNNGKQTKGKTNKTTVTREKKKDTVNEKKKEPTILYELENEKTLNSSTYLLSNGMKQSVYYSSNVRFEDENGEIQEYDAELVDVNKEGVDLIADTIADENKKLKRKELKEKIKKEYLYENNVGDSKQYFPKNIDEDTPLVMTKDDYKISFAPVSESLNSATEFEDEELVEMGESEDVIVSDIDVTDYEDNTEKKEVIAEYEYKDSEIILEYQSLEQGVKESIVLKEVPDSNVFSYVMTLENMQARINNYDGGITLYDMEGESIVAAIEAPFMNDASGSAYSEDIHYTLEMIESDGVVAKYLLSMVVSEEYLFDESRQYPVTIDPTTTWTGNDKIRDAYVISGSYANTNFYSSDVTTMAVGKNSTGKHRTYMKVNDLKSEISGKSVESATLTLYEAGNTTKGAEIQVKRIKKSFTPSSVTWNNKPEMGTVYGTLKMKGSAGAEHKLDVTTWARKIASGEEENNGIGMRIEDEGVSNFAKFYGSRYGTTSKRPKITIKYYDYPTSASSVTVDNPYVTPGQNLVVNWRDINSAALDYVQYRIVKYNETTKSNGDVYIGYSASTKIGNTATGKCTIAGSGGWPEGAYKIYVRGVDKAGTASTGVAAYFYIDRTKPTFSKCSFTVSTSNSNYSNQLPILSFAVADKYPYAVQVSVNGGAFTTFSYLASASGQITGLVSGKHNIIDVRARDKSGNWSNVTTLSYYYDKDAPANMILSTNPSSSWDSFANTKSVTVNYSFAESTTELVQYYVIDETILEKILNNDYDFTCEYTTCLPPSKTSGSFKVPLEWLKEGWNGILFGVADRAGNSNMQMLEYYVDTQAPTTGKIRISPSTSATNYRSAIPTVTWSGFADDYLKEIQVSINGGTYKAIWRNPILSNQEKADGSSGEALLNASDFTKEGAYNIKVRAIDMAGNLSSEREKTYYYKKTVSPIAEYDATEISAIEKIGGNTIITIKNATGEVPGDIEYEIYRGSYPGFAPHSGSLVKTGVQGGIAEIPGEEGVTYYYRVRAYTADGERVYGNYSDAVCSTTLTAEDRDGRTGTKDDYDYLGISTPNGNGSIEKTKGNFIYEQADLSLPAAQIPIEILRVYNSKSSIQTGFGYGWSTIYDSYISVNADKSKIYYQDCSKAVYTFTLQNNVYKCAEDSEISIEKWDNYVDRVIGNEEIEFKSTFIITNKDNEKYYFDELGRLVMIEEENGTFLYIKYEYNSMNIDYIETSAGNKIDYTYETSETSGKGLISKISIPDDSYYSYEYNEQDRLVKVTHNGTKGGQISYAYGYNESGYLTSIYDAEGNEYAIGYADERANVLTYPNGEYYELTYEEESKTAVVTKYLPGGAEIYSQISKFDDNGQLIEYVDALGNVETYQYDVKNENGQLTDIATKKVCYNEIVDGVITEIVENKLEVTVYDEYKNVISKTDYEGNLTVYTYNYNDSVNKNFPIEMKTWDKDPNVYTDAILTSHEKYEYDNNGNVVKSTDIITGTVSEYTYDANGNVIDSKEILVKDANSASTTGGLVTDSAQKDYDAAGNVTSESEKVATVDVKVKTEYDAVGRVIKDQTGEGDDLVVNEYEYDQFGRLVKTTQTSKGKTKETENEYYDNGSLKYQKDDKNRKTEFTYDNMNRPIEQVLTVGDDTRVSTMEYSYSSVTINDGKDEPNVVENAYVETTYYEGEVVGKTYVNGIGQTIRELSNGLYVDYTYDQAGRVFTTYTGGIVESDIENVVEGKLSLSLYDGEGNPTNVIVNPEYKDGHFIIGDETVMSTKVYDNTGMLVKEIDALGNETKYEYDNQGRVTKVILPDKSSNEYTYDIKNLDGAGNIISTSEQVKNALGNISTTTYDGAGQMTQIVDGVEGNKIVKSYEYDKNGQVAKEIYPSGTYTKFEYDEFGYVTKKMVCIPSGTVTYESSYEYDDDYNLCKVVDSNASSGPYRYTIYEYDNFGRNIGYAEVDATSNPTKEQIDAAMITYVYDAEDKLVKMYYPHNSNDKLKGVKFTYNKDKWLIKVSGLIGSDEDSRAIREYVYYNDGKIKEIIDHTQFLSGGKNKMVRTYEYDVLDRVTSMKYYSSDNVELILEQYEYTYDKNSNIISEREISRYENNYKDELYSHMYDKVGRLMYTQKFDYLTQESVSSYYKYDLVGNKIQDVKTHTIGYGNSEQTIYDYTYNELNQMIKCVETDKSTGTSYTSTYAYHADGNLFRATDQKTGAGTTCYYDNAGRLVYTSISSKGNSIIQTNSYDGSGKRIKKVETVNGNKITTNYYYEGNRLLYTTDENGNKTSLNVYGAEANVIAGIRYNGDEQNEYFYSKDIQGSTTSITDENFACVQAYEYTAFGETTEKLDTDFYNQICYTGGIYDEYTELYYMNARYYNPETATFISQDSYRGDKLDEDTWNLYSYCAGNPVSYVDPSGHAIDLLIDIVGCAADVYSFIKDPSVENAMYIAIDAACMVVPFVSCGGSSKTVVKAAGKVVGSMKKAGKAGSKVVRKSIKNVTKTISSKYGGKAALKKAGKAVAKKGKSLKKSFSSKMKQMKFKVNGKDLTSKGYYKDSNGRWHRANGQFASNAEVGLPAKAKVSSGTHGNSLNCTSTNYGYVLYDKNTNDILKFGETLYPNTRYTQNYLDSNNAAMKVLTSGSKADIHMWQYDMNSYFKYKYGTFPPLNSKGW